MSPETRLLEPAEFRSGVEEQGVEFDINLGYVLFHRGFNAEGEADATAVRVTVFHKRDGVPAETFDLLASEAKRLGPGVPRIHFRTLGAGQPQLKITPSQG